MEIKKKKYYRMSISGYGRHNGGVFFVDDNIKYFDYLYPEKFIKWEPLTLHLREGEYLPWRPSNFGLNIINFQIRDLFTQYNQNDNYLVFYPVEVKSEEYGDQEYYVSYFNTILKDVVDEEHSFMVGEGENRTIYIPAFFYNKIKDYDIFTYTQHQFFIVSDTVKKAMKKQKLDTGLFYEEIKCY